MAPAKGSLVVLSALAFVVFTTPPAHAQSSGPISPLYLTGVEFGSGPNTNRIKVVQGSEVIGEWDQSNETPSAVYRHLESAVAVSSSVKTYTQCSGACGSFVPYYTAEYALSGAFIGASAVGAVPLSDPGAVDHLNDGTTDGSRNYAVGSVTGNVYAFDTNWQNPTVLFTLPALPTSALWLGITYDPDNDSLWVSGHQWAVAKNYSKDGTLLSEFNLDVTSFGGLATGLAFDPADQTLWVGRMNPWLGGAVRFEQYSRQGVLLGSMTDPALQTFSNLGAEFPMSGATLDSDGDGVPNDEDAFPDDAAESADSDSDGIGDNADPFPESNQSPTVTVNGINTGVMNRLVAIGTTLADSVASSSSTCAAGAKNHGQYVSCMAHVFSAMTAAGTISNAEKGRLHSAIAKK